MHAKKIIVAVDLENLAPLKKIATLGLSPETEVHLVHVFEFRWSNFDFFPTWTAKKEDVLLAQKLLEEKLSGLAHDLDLEGQKKLVVRCLVAENAKQEFLQYVDVEKPEFVIAAAKERPAWAGFFEGSFTSFLSKFCRANVLLLRP